MFDLTSITAAIAGGAIIGFASAMLWIFQGRVAGISGIFGGVLDRKQDWRWRLTFIAGLLGGGLLLMATHPGAFPDTMPRSLPTIAVAGVLVGLGTRIGNGCTSGHGVCGLSRFSRRSMVATLTFISAGAVTVFVADHVLGGAL